MIDFFWVILFKGVFFFLILLNFFLFFFNFLLEFLVVFLFFVVGCVGFNLSFEDELEID